jgi:hypothetical protein
MASAHHGVPVEDASRAPHQITLRILNHSREEASCGGLSAVHRSDALRRLLRLMVAEGMSGPAEVRGGDGKLRMTVRSIEGAARFTLSEEDRDGFRLRRCPPEQPGWNPASASQSIIGNSPTAHA